METREPFLLTPAAPATDPLIVASDINSSLITRVAYRASGQEMFIEMKAVTKARGEELKCYRYVEVPLGLFTAFLSAPSQGEFYNDNVKGKYPSMPYPGIPTA